jgi:hypothetical protein
MISVARPATCGGLPYHFDPNHIGSQDDSFTVSDYLTGLARI